MIQKQILLAEDQLIVRQGLKMMLEFDGMYKTLEANNGLEAVQLTMTHHVDLILMDVRMPMMNGIEAVKEIRNTNKEVRIVMLTTFADEEYALESLKLGANGYILKDADRENLLMSIEKALKGEFILDGQVAAKVIPTLLERKQSSRTEIPFLSEREIEITRMVGEGLSNAEISEALFLTIGTVKNYVSQLFTKLDVRDRTQLAIYAVKHNI
ncbi:MULTISPECIES: response regulator [Shouchella]|uniref:Response regulator transcription factor n=2 Tax=Shouchella TaxID=2893057 RepID=A0ABY7W1H8_9BACI|nr:MULTISPECIES: response regulator transcription factor [Shouchella]MED4126888.1 response regulator transcription factor [Shouchella miscanthi]WDF02538.1 response regulator transcription factor [Shouchella hunanensis]